ncbi:hypothetical protein NADFUDRAFT_77741 [Nadsonia fulvescens var. elongata DSM 6958]|uniref:Uncharacterized protein n=1 Tax=Nadsonia fulvescens var. elongata DSM 6958 TaxID=857566 RepID=A0A1E3PLK5_9ASCO|nr:hypothetical protein NADFUDRAFT_77741 [Nadsonia fulvescens var. elongata DSM 6958]
MIPSSSPERPRQSGRSFRQQSTWQSSNGSPNWRAGDPFYRQLNKNSEGKIINNRRSDLQSRYVVSEDNATSNHNFRNNYGGAHHISRNNHHSTNRANGHGGFHSNRQAETRARFPVKGRQQNQIVPNQYSRDYHLNRNKGNLKNKSQDSHNGNNFNGRYPDNDTLKISPESKISSHSEMDAPKAYAPLGYGIPKPATEISKFDNDNDTPLPVYPERPSVLLERPISCTFADTEMISNDLNERKGHYAIRLLTKKPKIRQNSFSYATSNCMMIDPAQKLIAKHRAEKVPITLGKYVLEEDTLNDGVAILDNILKRNHLEELGATVEDKQTKKKRLNDSLGEASEDNINNTVSPEKVLRMVDLGLIDDSPKNKFANHFQAHHPSQLSKNKSEQANGIDTYSPYSHEFGESIFQSTPENPEKLFISPSGKPYVKPHADDSISYPSGFYDGHSFNIPSQSTSVISGGHLLQNDLRPYAMFAKDRPYYQHQRSELWKDVDYAKFKSEDTPSKSKTSTAYNNMTNFY